MTLLSKRTAMTAMLAQLEALEAELTADELTAATAVSMALKLA